MKHFKRLLMPSFLVLFAGMHTGASAQAGKFIQAWGGAQYVALENDNNYSTADIGSGEATISGTYRSAFGLNYIHNFNENYGWMTGFYYSGLGQKYYGTVSDIDVHMPDTVKMNYTSQLLMDYIKIPLFFRFNSEITEGSRLNVSIYTGFDIGYLMDVKSTTNPGIPDSLLAKYPNFDLKKLFNTVNLGFAAGAEFNIKLNNNLYGNIGVRFDRDITRVESYYNLPADAPAEWEYPVSTKKSERQPTISLQDAPQSQNVALNVYLGLTFKVANVTVKPHPHVSDEGNGE